MISKRLFSTRLMIVFISLCLCMATIYNRHLLFMRMNDADVWVEQFPILISAFLLLTLIHLIWPDIEIWVVSAKTIILFIFFLQYGPFPEILITLITSLFAETIIMKKGVRGIVVGLLVLGFVILNLTIIRGEAWIPEVVPQETIFFYLEYTILVFVFVIFIKNREERYAAHRHEIARLDTSVTQLTNANLDFQQYVYFVQQESIEKERNRISREIHDGIGYTLTNINMMMEAAVRLIKTDHDKLFTLLLRTRHQTETGLEDMRRSMRELRTLGADLLKGSAGIHSLSETFSNATGVRVRVEYGNLTWSFPPELENVIYRFMQEGMTNAFRHGKATEISIYFHVKDDYLNITVADNGIGAEQIHEGIGMKGMKERLHEFSGGLSARNGAEGFELKARIPIKEYISSGE